MLENKTIEDVKLGLECGECSGCPYDRNNYPDGIPRCKEVEYDAIALIERLESQIPKWISVEERLPETSGRYLVCISCPRGEWIESNRYDDSEHAWEADAPGYHECSTDYVTYWMPLPEPPKEV